MHKTLVLSNNLSASSDSCNLGFSNECVSFDKCFGVEKKLETEAKTRLPATIPNRTKNISLIFILLIDNKQPGVSENIFSTGKRSLNCRTIKLSSLKVAMA